MPFGSTMAGKVVHKRVGPFSTATELRKVDGRTREARIVRAVVADLVAQLGGHPSAAQRLLIQSAAIVTLRLTLALERYQLGGETSDRLDQHVVALINAQRQVLGTLGLENVKPAAISLAQYLEGRKAD